MLALVSLVLLGPAWLVAQEPAASPVEGSATPAAMEAKSSSVGVSRLDPAAPGEEVLSEGYAVTLLETIQGPDAAIRVQEVDLNNQPPAAGQEYVLARVRLRNPAETGQLSIASSNFGLTATANRLYPAAAVVPTAPELVGEVTGGGQLEGWLVVPVETAETNRQLVLMPGVGADPETYRYLAINVGASLPLSGTPTADPVAGPQAAAPGTPPNDLGLTAESPAAAGTAVVTGRVAIQIIETIRGEEATARLQETSLFNPTPLPANEHVLVQVRVTALGPVDEPMSISPLDFSLQGPSDRRYAPTGLLPPPPELDVRLFPGGSFEGKLAFEVAANDPELVLVYLPVAIPSEAPRYLLTVPIVALGSATPVPTP